MVSTESSSRGGGRRGRPPSEAKRTAVIEAALELFLDRGYARCSMDAITAAAGVSKQTVYAHFGDKEALFSAVIDELRSRTGDDPPGPLLADDDPRAALTAFGRRHVDTLLDPDVAALRRMLIAEVAHRPRLRELWNTGGPSRLRERLTAELSTRAHDGDLDIPDPEVAARHLVALLSQEALTRSLYGTAELPAAERDLIAAEVADLFLRAYGAPRR